MDAIRAQCGVYLLQGNPNAYLEFLSDGTFNAAGFWGSNVRGYWYADGDKITVTSQWGSGAGTMNENNFIDNDGRIWIKSGK